jgi:hypothetical protein
LRLQPHGLHSILDVSGLVEIGVAQLRRPGRVLSQIIEDRRKLDESFDGWIPRLGVRARRPLIGRQVHVLVQPAVGRGDLVRIGGRRQYGSHQRIRIERDRSYQLIQLFRVQLDIRRRRRRLRENVHLCHGNQQHRKHHRQQLARVFAN